MLRVLIGQDDFMVRSVHADFVNEVEGFEVAGTAANWDRSSDAGRGPGAGSAAARRAPAGHDGCGRALRTAQPTQPGRRHHGDR
ncbi:putative Protein-glutamate methylesterase [Nostocoides australiense Ben110]|uniref:Uncharacterized protein n=1 Tax=Nostocoides australiense Ben110 TaxID=1193182 RepID=W6K0P4_9MICO|nr:putative Protein-glutamate methylesterase [Tetrasphaera australiensis Ben110]